MSVRDTIVFEPVRSLSALLAFGAAVVAALSFGLNWSGEAASLAGGVWSAFVALINTFFVRNAVTPNEKVDEKVHDTIVDLAKAQTKESA